MNHMRRATAALLATVCLFGLAADGAQDATGPGKLEMGGARKRLEEFEKRVDRAKGQPFQLGYVEKEALRRVKALKEKYPDNADVQDLFERSRKALIASKGQAMDITPEMLAYRANEQKLKTMFADKADKALAKIKAAHPDAIAKPFPVPSHREVDADDLIGKYVFLNDFEYPANEFTSLRGQYVFVGSGAKGFYYVQLSTRAWRGAYEALRRYRMLINRDLPEDGKWVVLGKITGLELMIPQAGKKKTESAHWGWGVEPVAIYVPGCTLAMADESKELGGFFAGEDEMETIKGSMYSVTSIPDDVTPERLTEIFVTAIQEKNYPLYLECIDPERRKTPRALSRINYHWEWHQHRFATFYCHVTVGKATTRVIEGFDGGGSVEDFFLSEQDKADIKAHAPTLVETAELKSVAWDERGRQYGSPKPRFFKRVDKKRWYITNYPQPF